RAGHRLAVDELRPELAGMTGRHLEVIADHVVMADLQCGDRGLAGDAGLQCRDHPAALVAQALVLVELVRIPRRDEPAVTGEERQFGGKRTAEALDERAVLAEPEL